MSTTTPNTPPWVRGALIALVALIAAGLLVVVLPILLKLFIAALLVFIGVWALFAIIGLLRR